MKFVIAVALFALAVSAVEPLPEATYQFLFTKWATQHARAYHHDDFFNRFNTFKTNLDFIRRHNEGDHSYTLAMNQFGDLTAAEFKKYTGYVPRDRPRFQPIKANLGARDVPASVDWRNKNAVTPVKNQGQCGSCWAFSTTGSIEGAWAIKTGNLVSVSEQQLVDCSGSQGDQGCNGGLMDNAFQYVISNGGICAEDAYPYTAQDGTCQTTCSSVVNISSFVDVTPGDENALAAAVAQGPVSVAIEADQAVFQFYSSGIVEDGGPLGSCGTNLDHGVLAVGYGTDSATNKNYWIVKNSWGASWGDKGYVKIFRGANTCGIAADPSYPVV